MHSFYLDFITGVSLGIELFTGSDLAPGDKFACTIDFFIVRLTYVISESE
jgi:hypothetical protein